MFKITKFAYLLQSYDELALGLTISIMINHVGTIVRASISKCHLELKLFNVEEVFTYNHRHSRTNITYTNYIRKESRSRTNGLRDMIPEKVDCRWFILVKTLYYNSEISRD
jgi:hypothetical protein